jgi:hypothetical protein
MPEIARTAHRPTSLRWELPRSQIYLLAYEEDGNLEARKKVTDVPGTSTEFTEDFPVARK